MNALQYFSDWLCLRIFARMHAVFTEHRTVASGLKDGYS